MYTWAPPCTPGLCHAHLCPAMHTCALPCTLGPCHAHMRPAMHIWTLPCTSVPYHAHLCPAMHTCTLPCTPGPCHAHMRSAMHTWTLPCTHAPCHAHLDPVMHTCAPVSATAGTECYFPMLGAATEISRRGWLVRWASAIKTLATVSVFHSLFVDLQDFQEWPSLPQAKQMTFLAGQVTLPVGCCPLQFPQRPVTWAAVMTSLVAGMSSVTSTATTISCLAPAVASLCAASYATQYVLKLSTSMN